MIPQFENISIDDRKKALALIEESENETCEASFGCQYIWAGALNTQRAFHRGFYIVKNRVGEDEAFYPPFGSGELRPLLEDLREYCADRGVPLKFVSAPEGFVRALGAYSLSFEAKEDRDGFDYVYKSARLAELSGKKLHAKRNHVNKFITLFDYEVRPISAGNIEDMLEVSRIWCAENGICEDDGIKQETCSVRRLASGFDELCARGLLLYVSGKPIAYSAGTPHTRQSCAFVVHHEKAVSGYDGAYSMINREFAKTLCGEYEWLNREDDLGVPGLRKAKLSYCPDRLIKKYTVVIK